MSPTGPSGGFSLFPNTTAGARPPSRSQPHRQRAPTPQSSYQEPTSAAERSPPRGERNQSLARANSLTEGKQPTTGALQQTVDGGQSLSFGNESAAVVERPAPAALSSVPPRCDTAFSEAQTLVRSNSTRSRSSMAKLPIPPESTAEAQSSAGEPQALRSIFPTYNPNLPLDRQDYYPTQSSPTHIPRSAISRPLYSPDQWETGTQPAVRSPASMNGGLSGGATARWPPRHAEPPAHPSTSTGDELRGLWKVANGWKAQPSEGRVYCLKMTTEKDAPIYTLSSTTQPFYNLRLDPTSTSAYVTLSRRDPHKPVKSASSPGHNPGNTTSTGSSSTLTSIGKTDGKNWQEVLTTTLEEESRKLPPNDGLVALLYPLAAARMALERPDNAATVQLAEKECARLVWDADSSNYFVVHPALAMPFCVTVERSPALSRTEYTLEHIESPQHLGRLTRDGTGTGWLEIDTGIAAKIDAIYLVDVAVTALLLVAHKDEKFVNTEVFEPPPVLGTREGSLRSSRGGGRLSRLSLHNGNNSSSGRSSRNGRDSRQGQQRKKSKAKKSWPGKRMEEFEVDIESQTSELGKSAAKDKEKIPGLARGLIAILTFILKCIVWVIMIGFKSLAAVISGLAKCASSGK